MSILLPRRDLKIKIMLKHVSRCSYLALFALGNFKMKKINVHLSLFCMKISNMELIECRK